MPGSAETLPAGFRLTASGHPRRLPPEGEPLISDSPSSGFMSAGRSGSQLLPRWIKQLSVTMSLALQSSMRRWTTVPTTCIWIGFKVSYNPTEGSGLESPACLTLLYTVALEGFHIFTSVCKLDKGNPV